jgi:hypothetical protein
MTDPILANRILFAGMPASGKSTYIAALRHLILANDVPCGLELVELASDNAHINRLERDWIQCQPIERTQTSSEAWVELTVRQVSNGQIKSLTVPDLRGEAFEQPAVMGSCASEIIELVEHAEGLMLFTNANKANDALLISDMSDILPLADASSTTQPKPFDARQMPEEVKIVEFLQLINRRPRRSKPRKLAIIASAWDVVDSSQSGDPEAWFAKNRTMLHQFLSHNPDLWSFRTYGVSAQGGSLPHDKARLTALAKASERIQVVGQGASQHDLAAPLLWLMEPLLDSPS